MNGDRPAFRASSAGRGTQRANGLGIGIKSYDMTMLGNQERQSPAAREEIGHPPRPVEHFADQLLEGGLTRDAGLKKCGRWKGHRQPSNSDSGRTMLDDQIRDTPLARAPRHSSGLRRHRKRRDRVPHLQCRLVFLFHSDI